MFIIHFFKVFSLQIKKNPYIKIITKTKNERNIMSIDDRKQLPKTMTIEDIETYSHKKANNHCHGYTLRTVKPDYKWISDLYDKVFEGTRNELINFYNS